MPHLDISDEGLEVLKSAAEYLEQERFKSVFNLSLWNWYSRGFWWLFNYTVNGITTAPVDPRFDQGQAA